MPAHQLTLNRFFSSQNAAAKHDITPPSAPPSKKKRVIEDDTDEAEENGQVKNDLIEENEPVKNELIEEKEPIEQSEPKLETVDNDISKHKVEHELKDASELLKLKEAGAAKQKPLVPGKPIPYASLCSVFQHLEDETGRLKNLAIASEYFLKVLNRGEGAETNLIEVTYLMINRLGPDYDPDLELGLGESLLLKALSQSTGRELKKIREDYHKYGDIGIVAQQSRSKQSIMFKPKPLTVDIVFKNLTDIAKSTGNSSQSRKIGIINRMLAACDGEEAKFLMRSLEGKLRINFGEKSVLVALAKAFVQYEDGADADAEVLVNAEEQIKQAFSQLPNYEILIRNAIKYGIGELSSHCNLQPGIPVKPMLAKPTKSIGEIMDTLQKKAFTCEYKYDGERAQVHLMEDGQMRVYSRSSENMTERYPDLIPVIDELRAANPQIKNLILDSECVAFDTEQHKILPFQVLATRKRKDVQEKDIKVRVCLYVFDMLYFNGESLIQLPLVERRKYLFSNVQPIDEKLRFATRLDSTNTDEISAFLDQSVKDSCEGLMIKTTEGTESKYEPSKRSRNWLKLKKDYLDGVGDSLDLVVVGGYIGKGKRTGWYGGFLLAAYNQDTGEYESVCKIGTGFSEELLAKLAEQLKPQEIQTPKAFYVYDKDNSNAKPDIWFEPSMVFEVKVADLTTSPIYKCGASYFGDGEKGISLRFPRFIQIRTDKTTEDATSSEQIVEMYESQAVLQ